MLIKIRLENFKSFDQSTELTMISSSKIRKKANHRYKIKNTQILKYGVVYGANASGKSNLIEFFRFFKSCVKDGLSLDSAQLFCKNREENKERESSFEIQLAIEDRFYAYGFSAVLSECRITAEWLYELSQTGNARCLFEREGTKKPVLGDGIALNKSEITRFETYTEDFEGSKTALFLSEMNRGKKYAPDSKLTFFKQIYQWIVSNIVIITPRISLIDMACYYNEQSLSKISQLIQSFDTGIDRIYLKEISMEELARALPKPILDDLKARIQEDASEAQFRHLAMTMRSDDSFFTIEVDGTEEPRVTTLNVQHTGSFYDFEFSEESDGTRRIFDLMDMLMNQKDDVIYVVDELERSLHPKLTAHFLDLFMESHKGQRVQLLFTTHESSIMDQEIFRRDEIWFVERDISSNSKIYSLDRFKDRYDKVLSKAYLDGRYGAVPVLLSFQFKEE